MKPIPKDEECTHITSTESRGVHVQFIPKIYCCCTCTVDSIMLQMLLNKFQFQMKMTITESPLAR